MPHRAARIVAVVALGYALALFPELAWADDKAKADDNSKAPDWSGYVSVTDLVGEVVRADEKKLKLRVTWYVPHVQGGNVRRPPLTQNNRNFRNPFAPNRNAPRVTLKEQHHDYELAFLPQSLVRTKVLPPKYDEKGKRVNYTPKELQELRSPPGVVGYAASKEDLRPGLPVEVWVVRDRSIPAAKVTEDDLRVKYVLILADPLAPGK